MKEKEKNTERYSREFVLTKRYKEIEKDRHQSGWTKRYERDRK